MPSISDNEAKQLSAFATTLMEKKNYRSATLVFDALYRSRSELGYLLQAAIAARSAGDAGEAEIYFSELVNKGGENASFCMEAGLFRLQEAQYEEAYRLFRKAYEIRPSGNAAVWSGVSLARCNKHQEALIYFREALSHDPNLLSAKVELAGSLESLGDLKGAIDTYTDIVRTTKANINPASLTYIYNRLGLCYERVSAEQELSALLDKEEYWQSIGTAYAATCTLLWSMRLGKNLPDERVIDVASNLTSTEGFNQLIDVLTLRLVGDPQPESFSREQLSALIASNSYGKDALKVVNSYGLADILAVAKQIPFVEQEQAIDIVVAHVRSGVPFSLIRIGDGEGSFLGRYVVPDSQFLAAQAQKILSNWFGNAAKNAAEYDQLYHDFHEAMVNADLLGTPDAARVKLELAHEPRGYWGVYFALLYVYKNIPAYRPVLAGIHSTLFRSPRFIDALRSLSQLNTISCHEGFGPAFRKMIGVETGEDLLVPGEMGIRELPLSSKNGDHYPTEYLRVIDQISTLRTGSVTLISAGICGKVYADRVKKAGGVAIDIGAMSDLIMGFNTREPFQRKEFRAHYDNILLRAT